MVQIRFTKMRNAYRSSPFFLETVKSGQVDRVKGSQPDVGQYEDEVRTAAAETRRPLHEVQSSTRVTLIHIAIESI